MRSLPFQWWLFGQHLFSGLVCYAHAYGVAWWLNYGSELTWFRSCDCCKPFPLSLGAPTAIWGNMHSTHFVRLLERFHQGNDGTATGNNAILGWVGRSIYPKVEQVPKYLCIWIGVDMSGFICKVLSRQSTVSTWGLCSIFPLHRVYRTNNYSKKPKTLCWAMLHWCCSGIDVRSLLLPSLPQSRPLYLARSCLFVICYFICYEKEQAVRDSKEGYWLTSFPWFL